MGFRRRTRRRALVAGAAIGHHRASKEQDAYEEQEAAQPAAEPEPQYAPPAVDPADQIEHLAQLHASGALTDEEFAAAKAKALA